MGDMAVYPIGFYNKTEDRLIYTGFMSFSRYLCRFQHERLFQLMMQSLHAIYDSYVRQFGADAGGDF